MMRLVINLFGQVLSPVAKNFYQALANTQAVQESVQKEIFQLLIKSEYGNYLSIKSIDDWERIPIVEYEDIQKWINSGVSNKMLTPEPIIFYEKTSGSRSAAKLIPYTKSLRKSFSQMFCVWAHDLIVNSANLSTGKIYFCVSPQLGNTTTPENVKIGLEDDSEYLDGWLRWFLSPFLVSPPGINSIRDPNEFKDKLAQTLLLEENLEIISIWNPSFLKVHLDYIQANQQRLAEQLKNQISAKRYQLLLQPEIPWTKIWSELKLISCWDSAHAKEQANYLRSLFPNVIIQGKGLLATEAPITIPLIKAQGCVPVLNEVFFEFEDQLGNIYRLHELEKGKAYSIIISQKGGLYRYRIGDRIRVTHYYLDTPCLEFIGRTETTSDLVGEKLHEDFGQDTLDSLQLEGTFFKSLVPVRIPTDHYLLLLDQANLSAEIIAQLLDQALMRSHHYQQARLLGQLDPPQVLISVQIPEIITNYKMRQGMKWGDIKHQLLVTTPIDQELLNLLNYA